MNILSTQCREILLVWPPRIGVAVTPVCVSAVVIAAEGCYATRCETLSRTWLIMHACTPSVLAVSHTLSFITVLYYSH